MSTGHQTDHSHTLRSFQHPSCMGSLVRPSTSVLSLGSGRLSIVVTSDGQASITTGSLSSGPVWRSAEGVGVQLSEDQLHLYMGSLILGIRIADQIILALFILRLLINNRGGDTALWALVSKQSMIS